jgi:surface antigen
MREGDTATFDLTMPRGRRNFLSECWEGSAVRPMLLAVPLCLLVTETSAAAQFPFGISRSKPKGESQAEAGEGGCKMSTAKRRGSRIAGDLLGNFASRALGNRASAVTNVIPVNTFTNALTDAIACRLDQAEQKQAATATEEAVKGGVGTKSTWTSATRKGVSGSSSVVAANTRAGGASCMTVEDVIIVEGEETTVSKQMCRNPGGTGYVLST